MAMQVGIYVYDEVEVLDFAGPFEVFSTAARMIQRDGGNAPFEVVTLAPSLVPVRARAGLNLLPHHALSDHPPLDVLIIPGGDVTAELDRPRLSDWILAQSLHVKVLASVCTGAFLLEKAGLLNEREAITHWEDIELLRSTSHDSGSFVQVLANQRWVSSFFSASPVTDTNRRSDSSRGCCSR